MLSVSWCYLWSRNKTLTENGIAESKQHAHTGARDNSVAKFLITWMISSVFTSPAAAAAAVAK